MSYVDGFVVPVPKRKRAAYVAMARKAAARSGRTTARSTTASASPTT